MYTAVLGRGIMIELFESPQLFQLVDNGQSSILGFIEPAVRDNPKTSAFGLPAFFKKGDQSVKFNTHDNAHDNRSG